MSNPSIVFTEVDEAPALALYSLFPILQAYTKGTGICLEKWDISLAGRIIASFPEYLSANQRVPDYLGKLGELCKQAEANIVKLPNISASIPQLQEAIRELQAQGYNLPDYPDTPQTAAEEELQARYARVLGSAVNPVLREGNSDRRAATAVKRFARQHPHRLIKPWPANSRARVAQMKGGDFYGSEKSITIAKAGSASIEMLSEDGKITVLKAEIPLLAGEIIDAAVMSVTALREFYREQIAAASYEGILLSLHLKATMMKVSDPIIFGHCVEVFYQDVFTRHTDISKKLKFNPNNGLAELYAKIESLPEAQKAAIEADIQAVYRDKCKLAMVDSDLGITNLHRPNQMIIDASMPVFIRDGGRMWGPEGQLRDAIAMIPDRSYAPIYQELALDCQTHGALDPATMGSVANVGLMAQQAEEYGSHDKTLVAQSKGTIRVIDNASGAILLSQPVDRGDIFRACQTKDAPVRDWIKLALARARATQTPAIFWLDPNRAHDFQLIAKLKRYLPDHDLNGLDLRIMPPQEAMRFTLARLRRGEDSIAVTGNVLRDYLTDLFPILELGTSAKMLSIVPLMNGGGLFETGAGGSAPKHVQQFLREGHLRWDSLGEFCALIPSFEQIHRAFHNPKAAILAKTLDQAIGSLLENEKSPSPKVGELDTRGSHFYLALYWSQALAKQDQDGELKTRFSKIAQELALNEAKILQELNAAQGQAVDIGGYYRPDFVKASQAMRPSPTFNAIIGA